MRHELDIIKKIEQFLQGNLTPEEIISFEKELATNSELKMEVELQQQIISGLERISIKADASKACKAHLFKTKLNNWSIAAVSIVVMSLIVAYVLKNTNEKAIKNEGPVFITDSLTPHHEHIFVLNTSRDTTIKTADGQLISIPANSLVDENHKQLKGSFMIEVPQKTLNNSTNNTPLSTIKDSVYLKSSVKNAVKVYTIHFYSPRYIDSLRKITPQVKSKNLKSKAQSIIGFVSPKNYVKITSHQFSTDDQASSTQTPDLKKDEGINKNDSVSSGILALNITKLKLGLKSGYNKIVTYFGYSSKDNVANDSVNKKAIMVFDINNKHKTESGIDSTSAKILSKDLKNKSIISKKLKSHP